MPELTLYVEDQWVSPWVMHAMAALEEKKLPYVVEPVTLPVAGELRAELLDRAGLAKVPLLRHRDHWCTESLAISEYVAETFPAPAYARLFPANLAERARARQVMHWLRTDLFALRAERPTSGFLGEAPAPATAPLSDEARAQADTLVRVAGQFVAPERTTLFAEWCIADVDLALALRRLVASGEPVPAHLAAYVEATWARPCMQRFLARGARA
ncbi:MAG: glutathione transferase [Myxococcales bacterium]|nr:glutathione transferase [Myxococcales bacterium]